MGDVGDIDRWLAGQSGRVARMEERMKTLEANLDANLSGFRTDMEKRDTEAARRDTVNTRWTIVAIVGALAAAVALLSWQDSQQAPAAAPQPQPIIIQLPPQTLAPVSQPPAAPVGATEAEPGPREP